MKKILTFIILAIFSLNINYSFSYNDTSERKVHIKQMIISKSKLKNSQKGQKYIKIIDKFIDKNGKNLEALEKINKKLKPILENSSSVKSTETIEVFKYINAKIEISILEINKNNLNIENLSDEEKTEIENEILDLQLNLFNSSSNYIENLIGEFDKYSNYQEKGNLNIDFKFNQKELGEISSELNFNNYNINYSGLDSQIKGELIGEFSSKLNNKEKESISFSSFVDMISKDSEIYLLIKDFKSINNLEDKSIDEIVEIIKEIDKSNDYIKISNNQAKLAANIFKNLSLENYNNRGREILSKPLFDVYGKEGDKYILEPNSNLCKAYKEINETFDPFNGVNCSDSQIEKMKKELAEFGRIYYKSGEEKEIGIYDNTNKANISFNNEKILGLFLEINEGGGNLLIDYKSNNYLISKLYISDLEKYNFESILDKNNKFSQIDFDLILKDDYIYTKADVKLENNKINGNFYSDLYSYDWYSGETKKSTNTNLDINGSTNSNNSLSKLDLNLKLKDYSNNLEIVKSDFNYNSGDYSFYLLTDFQIGKFETDIKIENKMIFGNSSLDINGENYFTVNTNGKYEDNYIKLDNKFKLKIDPVYISLQGYTADARNSKRVSDINNIGGAISIKLMEGEKLENIIILNNEYKVNGYVGGNNLVLGENYFVGTLNYEKFNIKKEDFLDPNGDEYIIAITNQNGLNFQIMAIMEIDTDLIARIMGTYNKKEINDVDGLIKYKNKVIKNNDIIGKNEKYINEYNYGDLVGETYINLNIENDLRNNKNNNYIYLDLLRGSEKIIEFNLENNSKKYFNKIEIDKPINIKDIEELPYYENEIKKARDYSRITKLFSIHGGIEQFYQDNGEYPNKEKFLEDINMYFYYDDLELIIKDELDGKTINGCTFGYKYEVYDDKYGIKNGAYKISNCLETEEYIEKYAKTDGGNDDLRYEKYSY